MWASSRPTIFTSGPGLLNSVGSLVAPLQPTRVLLLTHPVIARLHGQTLLASLAQLGPEVILVPAGERHKSLRQAARLYDELLARGADRRSVVVTFGGGVIGDLGGFVAATYMRGLRFVQVPTTVLAQVDASVGGKVAVDHPRVKNLIGAFHQPALVVADTSVLRTLPAREFRSGLAEVVKHGVIADADFFGWLESSVSEVNSRDVDVLTYVVRRNCEIKAAVVGEDEKERGRARDFRISATPSGTRWRASPATAPSEHGEAVAVGMVAAAATLGDSRLGPPGGWGSYRSPADRVASSTRATGASD